jgi:hypothetical protein
VSRDRRLRRLRELLDQIERLPASHESERMLREVRARIVDVDTGVAPREMLPVDPDPTLAIVSAPPTAQTPKVVASPPPVRRKPVPEAPAEAVPASGAGSTAPASSFGDDGDWLSRAATDEVLSLADSAPHLPAGEARAGLDRRPWTRGLRG